MKKLFLIALLANNLHLFAQEIVEVRRDTIIERKPKEVLRDPNLVFPKLKSPISLCDSLKVAWQLFITSGRVKKYIPKFNNNDTYYSGLNIEINYLGQVSGLTTNKVSNAMEKALYTSIKKIMTRTTWQPGNKIFKHSTKNVSTNNLISFMIKGDHIMLFEITDIKSGSSFFKCMSE